MPSFITVDVTLINLSSLVSGVLNFTIFLIYRNSRIVIGVKLIQEAVGK